jgi:hypothetical protein
LYLYTLLSCLRTLLLPLCLCPVAHFVILLFSIRPMRAYNFSFYSFIISLKI